MSGINILCRVAGFARAAAATASLGASRTVKIFHYISAKETLGGEKEAEGSPLSLEIVLSRLS